MVKQILHIPLKNGLFSYCFRKRKIQFFKQFNLYSARSIVILVSLLFFSTIVKANVVASVDKQSLELGDNLQLTIYAGNISNNAVPDLSNVVNDFDLLSSGQTQQVAMSNNRMVTETVWIFTLSPKHAGMLTIPTINIGNQHTLPINIRVDTITSNNATTMSSTKNEKASAPPPVTPTKAATTTPDIFLKAVLSPSSPYVQSQAIYTLYLYYDKQITGPEITDPSADGANFIRINQNDVYQKVINGRPYQVIEMKYALFPEKSGTLTIKGPTLTGNMLMGSMAAFSDADFKSIQTAANSIKVTIKPIPAIAANSWWLPATDVQISEQWSSDLGHVQVGVPITRTVKLAAQGIMATQLPVMISNNVPGFHIYPDKPAMTSSSDGENVFGTRIEKAAYVPTESGTVTLPAVVVNWWDTRSDMMKTATLPTRTITVLPAANGSSAPINPMLTSSSSNHEGSLISNLTTKKSFAINKIVTENYWFWIAVSLGIVWIITIIAWLIYRNNTNRKITSTIHENESEVSETWRQAKSQVEQAVKAQNPQQFSTALINFSQRIWPEAVILSLTDIASQCQSAPAKAAIEALDKIRYSSNSGTWQADATWQIIMKELVPKKATHKKNNGELPGLYLE